MGNSTLSNGGGKWEEALESGGRADSWKEGSSEQGCDVGLILAETLISCTGTDVRKHTAPPRHAMRASPHH